MSTIAAALAHVDAFEAEVHQEVAWALDRAQTLQRLRTLINDPVVFHQRGLNVCGPAVFFRIWLARDPLAVAKFACTLLHHGSAHIGTMLVAPNWRLKQQDYAALRAATDAASPRSTPEIADWMLMSALRNSENLGIDYTGEPNTLGEMMAAVTLPMTLAAWLSATNLYSSVSNETTVFPGPDPQRLLSLLPATDVDIVLLVNSSFDAHLHETRASRPAEPPTDFGLHIPNHYVLMIDPCGLDGAWLYLHCWTWGRNTRGWVGPNDFARKYYGFIIATAR